MRCLSLLMTSLCVLITQTPSGVYLKAIPALEVQDENINERIKQALEINPEKDSSDYLSTVFNDEHKRLEEAIIDNPNEVNNTEKAEEALKDFNEFLKQYDVATKQIESIECDPDCDSMIQENAQDLSSEIEENGAPNPNARCCWFGLSSKRKKKKKHKQNCGCACGSACAYRPTCCCCSCSCSSTCCHYSKKKKKKNKDGGCGLLGAIAGSLCWWL